MPDRPPNPSSAPRDNDADDWLEALAGRPRAGAAPGLNAEATLLREAFRRWPAAAPALSAAQQEAHVTALLAAARANPALAAPEHHCGMCQALRRWLSTPSRRAAAMALVVAMAIGVTVLPWQGLAPPTPGPDADDTLRGSARHGVQRLRAADPKALRDRLADELTRAGIAVKRYQQHGRYGLDAELPATVPHAVGRALGEQGLLVSPGDALAVEVESASP